MGAHKNSDHNARKAKYQNQVRRTDANKKRHLAKMKELNPNYPGKKNG